MGELLNFNSNLIYLFKQKATLIPLPLQSVVIPIYLKGQDFICLAKTGSGKTLCYLIPSLKLFQIKLTLPLSRKFYELFISPTRELSLQIYKELSTFCIYMNVNIICSYGGAPNIIY